MDFITNLLPSTFLYGKVYNTILIVVDRLTKYIVYIEITGKLIGKGLANLLIYYIFAYFGISCRIVSDYRTLFIS